jgi:hypothetical protein
MESDDYLEICGNFFAGMEEGKKEASDHLIQLVEIKDFYFWFSVACYLGR